MPKTKKVAKWRKSVRALKRVKSKKTRFTTKVFHTLDTGSEGLRIKSFVKVFDNSAKRYIRGEWELSHALAVLGHLLENPSAAVRFGYDTRISTRK